MQSSFANLFALVLIALGLCQHSIAQVVVRDTPAHRRIPLVKDGTPPSLDNFLKSPELQALHKEYRRLRMRQREKLRPTRTQRLPGESAAEVSERERLLQQTLEVPIHRRDIEEEIRSASEQLGRGLGTLGEKLGQGLGQAFAESMKSDSIEFDAGDTSTWDLSSRIKQDIQRKTIEAQQQYQQAKEMFERSWPTDSVAPDEWLNKVQPFINSEVIEQLGEATRQFEAQKHLPPDQRRFQDIEGIPSIASRDSKPNSMFDSIMTSIDKQGTNWLKSSDKENSSLWKSFKNTAKKGITSLNQRMTENSRKQANSPVSPIGTSPRSTTRSSQNPTRRPTTTNGSSANSDENNRGSAILPVVLGLCVVSAIAAYLFRDQLFPDSSSPSLEEALAMRIQDRESLLSACHVLAHRLFGLRSRFWNHRKLFRNLSERIDGRDHCVTQLARIYEHARYAPGELLDAEFAQAQELFVMLQRGLRNTPASS